MKKILYTLAMGGLLLSSQLQGQLVLQALEAPASFTPTDKCVERVRDRKYGDGDHNFIYCAVIGPDGQKWLNLNLGAEYAREGSPYFNPEATPVDHNDWKAFGSLFQYNRRADGHELVTYQQKEFQGEKWWFVDRKYPRKEAPQDDIYTSDNAYASTDHSYPWLGNYLINKPVPNIWDSQREPKDYAHNPCPEGYEILTHHEIYLLMEAFGKERTDYTIKGGLSTPSVFIHKEFPNIHLVTAPHSVHTQEQGMERAFTYADISKRENATSGLWLMGLPDNLSIEFSEIGGRSGWNYYTPSTYGENIGRLDRGIFSKTSSQKHEYGMRVQYSDYPEAMEGYDPNNLNKEFFFSLPIRCVEKIPRL